MDQIIANAKEIIAIASAVLAILSFILKQVSNAKNAKLRKLAEGMNKVVEHVEVVVQEAENFVNFKGKDKKEWALTKVNQWCIDNGVEFDPIFVDKKIEEIVALTKKVNARQKDMEVLP